MPDQEDYYEVLGLQKDCTAQQVIEAYRKLAFRYHPDLHPNDEKAAARFKLITEAFEVLTNDEKRRLYDERGKRRDEPETFDEIIAKKAAAASTSRVTKGATFSDLFTKPTSANSGGKGGLGDLFGRKKPS
jgi:DnaJ-class molecular chaperone